ncbi:hypothetical protein ACVNP1_00865 [Staphylococcus aureus]
MWLEQEGYPKLERTSQGNFIVSSEIMTLLQARCIGAANVKRQQCHF